MEIKIGVRNIGRELNIETDQTAEQIESEMEDVLEKTLGKGHAAHGQPAGGEGADVSMSQLEGDEPWSGEEAAKPKE